MSNWNTLAKWDVFLSNSSSLGSSGLLVYVLPQTLGQSLIQTIQKTLFGVQNIPVLRIRYSFVSKRVRHHTSLACLDQGKSWDWSMCLHVPEVQLCYASVDFDDSHFFKRCDGNVFFQGTIANDGFSMVLLLPDHHHWMFFLQIDHWQRWFFNGFSQIQVRWSTMVLVEKDHKNG